MSPLPDFVTRPAGQWLESARGTVGGITWGPSLKAAKWAVHSLFSNVEFGTLIVLDEMDGTSNIYSGNHAASNTQEKPASGPERLTSPPRVELVVKKSAFWMRLVLFADMGFAESFMLGEVECNDLTDFFQLFIANRNQLGNGTTLMSTFSSLASTLARRTNTLHNALLNISAHYDISNEMFAAFLSPDMTYSCPIWKHSHADEPEETLEEAQHRKLQTFISEAHIKSTDHVLEIGTGWGSFAIAAVQTTGCRVTSLTLSIEQKVLAEERIAEAGLSDRIEVLLMDYRALPVPERPYDKIVSIEMLEAVGKEYLSTYFACIDRLLKKDGGIAVFQCITMPEGRYEAYSKSEDFINHYIFPGGHLPSITQLLNHISTESQGTLIVERVNNIGGHYAKTLRLWREAFLDKFDSDIKPALIEKQGKMKDDEVAVFRRKWEYYFRYCEAGFLSKTLGDVIITVGREGTAELMEGIPT
ncbi:cyclopropane-fatty-acyl-phospholipid synthase [Coniella lustricola]|uniref:Cyclopropane-fatty-acyl-phospholipid synthase n=1 Tax=Coniella lustricola TaxID=2025994 RepID=A0A2T3ABT8_9PEZI|nr:cyclopropane-fatty-acyl-phospholipid synthase [Coniella lustricola]